VRRELVVYGARGVGAGCSAYEHLFVVQIAAMQNVAHGDDIRFGKFVLEEVARDRLDALRKSSRIDVLLSERGDRVVDGFPLTISGKVQKYLIRDRMRSELNLTEGDHA
jgi:hypothetical protein